MVVIAISGSVGTGKTSLASELVKKLEGFEVVNLNSWAHDFKIEDVSSLQTFDFNLEGLIAKVNRFISDNLIKNYIFEGHFAHFINPELVDFLFVVNRDLKSLRQVYEKRGYNNQKINDNLEVESFNLCFYEGIEEGYREEEQIFCLGNDFDLKVMVDKILVHMKK